jgi:anthraniloyl-CoA monooxygenase
MRVAIIGGGPAGLYFALLMRKAGHEVRLHERNAADSTFGWGVVFSDQTLGALRQADAPTAELIHSSFNHWDDIDVHFRGQLMRSGGHGFCGIGRMRLLEILQARCRELGVALHFGDERPDDEALGEGADLIIAADGLNSRVRQKYAATYAPDIDLRACRFVWLGTKRLFDAFTFDFQPTPWGWFQAHAYRFDEHTSTFIVETHGDTWQRAGLDTMGKEEGIAFCEQLFERVLGGEKLMSNAHHLRGSAQWIRFPRVVCARWVHRNAQGVPVVLMGDAAHTAHFSIGSGTKLALEDAIDLSRRIAAHGGTAGEALDAALAEYERVRGVEVLKIQNAARNSTEWFENVERHAKLEPEQFAYSLLTRSQRISHENLRVRDAAYVGGLESWLGERAGLPGALARSPVPPMFTPYTLRGCQLPNRVVVSPMAQYSAAEGVPGDFHLVHLGARALGGAGLVFVEMSGPSADARITPGCPGLWNDAQEAAFARIVGFIHAQSQAKVALQLGHAGPKGSTNVPWLGPDDAPLPAGNWPLLSASAFPYAEGRSAQPKAMDEADMQRVLHDFVAATERAARAGFDWLELHCAHGYLLSAFLSPLTNQRSDAYGGSLAARLRYPLQVFRAMRAVWPQDKPMSVRLSAHDWVPGGNMVDDAVEIARAFQAEGCDLIDVSSGQVSPLQKPVYGRMYQTPFAERIRNELGMATMAVGAITEADHVNSIIAAGRADLCALARPHLADAAWTLHEAARLGHTSGVGAPWPPQYLAGKAQLERELARQKAAAAQAAGLSAQEQANLALGV